MERRREPRITADGAVTVKILKDGATLPAHLLNLSPTGLALRMESEVPLGTLVSLEWDDHLLLAEVVHCRPSDPGFFVGMHLEHTVCSISDLAALNRQVAELSPGTESATPA